MPLTAAADLAQIAAAIGHPARAAMLDALLGGVALPAGELARNARVAPATASEHLARLEAGGLVRVRRAGRHRYFELAGRDVAAALEALARVASTPRSVPAVQMRAARPAAALRAARTCYDHLAGALGVRLAEVLRQCGLIDDGFSRVTQEGDAWLRGLGIDIAELRRGRRTLVRPCLDWTERQDHLAGAVAAALTTQLLERRWVVRLPATRAVRLTVRGRDGLYRALGVDIATPEPGP